jgi:hypothetical protein
VVLEDPPHRELAGRGEVYELAVTIEEEVTAGGAKLLAEQELFDSQRALGISKRIPNGFERDGDRGDEGCAGEVRARSEAWPVVGF